MSSDADRIESRVIEYLENAIACTNENEKVSFLNRAQELVINHDILDNFLDEILGFQSDKFSEIRKFVAGFIEATCKKEPDYFPKVIINLSLMLADEIPNVLKKVIQVLTQLYHIFLKWISSAKINEEIESTWEAWNQIKNQVFSLIDLTENDGVRTQCVKFIEMVIICQTRRDNFSKDDDHFSLDQISENIDKKIIDLESMEDEAKQLFEQLINFQSKIHISSVNLMATMQSLAFIARQRSKLFFNKVVNAFEQLSSNLPPTLAKLQVNSVNKQLKLLLVMLFKHPYVHYSKQQTNMMQTLLKIGVKQHEINRCLQEVKKHAKQKNESNLANETKRIKIEIDDDDEDGVDASNNNNSSNGSGPNTNLTTNDSEQTKFNLDSCLHELSKRFSRYDAIKAADITAKDLIGRLNNSNVVCDIVMASLPLLPENLDNNSSWPLTEFSFSMNDTAAIAKKMAFYFTGIGIGPGVDEILNKHINLFETQYKMKMDSEINKKVTNMLKKFITKEMKNQQQSHSRVKLMQSGKSMTSAMKIKQLKLEDITKPLDFKEKIKLLEKCVVRILVANQSGHFSMKQYENYRKIIGKFSSEFACLESLKCLIKDYIFQDIRSRYDILFNAIYLEYIDSKVNAESLDFYSEYLHWIIENVLECCEPKDKDFFLQKLYLESPYLDNKIIDLFKKFVMQSEDFQTSSAILKLLVEKRAAYRENFLHCLLQISIETEKLEVHEQSMDIIKVIYQSPKLNLKNIIEQFALDCLNRLKTDTMCLGVRGNQNPEAPWNDDSIKVLLTLYLLLLPMNQQLIHQLPDVYVASDAQIKRAILRHIQEAIEQIDMNSPEMIQFVKNCIDGSETLISRVIHILTDKKAPSTQLVNCVKDLYQKRVSDVRFLIPVLRGFSKKEIIEILPQLIKLNPNLVKDVFIRLLASDDSSSSFKNKNAISPADLMIALHNIDTSKCDLKTIIKAIQICFEEKSIFTSEVLAVVMQMLTEQNQLPTLLMRTVIQTLSYFPRLIGFVMNNILQRLILKQVWNQKKVWEGFIKCCQRTMPQSFPVLFQLPVPQLESVFESCPEIKPALINYINEFKYEQQIGLIPQSILDCVLSGSDAAIWQENINQTNNRYHPTVLDAELSNSFETNDN